MTEDSAFPGARIASRPAPERIYKPRRGHDAISVLPKSCYRRSLNCDKAVIWRMLVEDDGFAGHGLAYSGLGTDSVGLCRPESQRADARHLPARVSGPRTPAARSGRQRQCLELLAGGAKAAELVDSRAHQ